MIASEYRSVGPFQDGSTTPLTFAVFVIVGAILSLYLWRRGRR